MLAVSSAESGSNARTGEQRTTDSDALAFAAGKFCRVAALDETTQAQPFHHLFQMHLAFGRRNALQAVFQIGAHRQMGKQAGLLEHVAQCSAMRRHKLRIVLPRLTVHSQRASGALQPGDAAQQGGLAGTGRAKQGGDTKRRRIERGIQYETFELQHEVRADLAHCVSFDNLPPARYSPSNTLNENNTMPPASRCAALYSIASTWL